MMPEFDTADVRRYYDRNTGNFVAHGEGGGAGALHRAVWGPGVDDAEAAFHYVENRLLARLRELPAGERPAHVVDLGCGVRGSLCHLVERLPLRGTGLTLSPVQVRHAERRIREAGLSGRVRCLEADYCEPPPDLPPADLAYAIESLVHGPDPARFFAACARIVRPGGLLAVCDRLPAAGRRPRSPAGGRPLPAGLAPQHPAPSLRAARPRGAGRVRAPVDGRPDAASAARASPRPSGRGVHYHLRMAASRPDAVRASGGRNRPADLSGKGLDRIRSRAVPPHCRCGDPVRGRRAAVGCRSRTRRGPTSLMSDDPIRYWDALTTVDASALAARDPVIVLPVAAIEQHGPHLPLSTDLVIGLGVLTEAFRRLSPDLPAWALPPLAMGASGEHRRFAGTLSLSPELLVESLVETGAAVGGAGVRRLVVSNSHGGNVSAVDIAARRLREDHDLLVVKTSWFDAPRPDGADLPDEEWRYGLHGGAVETAMMRHLRPDLVRLEAVQRFPSLDEDLSGALRQVSAEGGASFAWLAGDLNRQGVTGDATLGTAELGAGLVAHYGRVLAEVIQDARRFPLDRLA